MNSTFGVDTLWRAHAVDAAVTLQAGQTGPLELTLFLKTNLQKTNVGTYSQFRIDIYPGLIPATSGVPACFFFQNVPAVSCSITNSPNNDTTVIKLTTPADYSFQQSEIPITITNVGQTSGSSGLTLVPLVKRYLFHIHIWGQQCDLKDINLATNTCVPEEVYFTEFVPQAI